MNVSLIGTMGELIHKYRRSQNMTLAQLSDLSGIPKGTISRIENEEVKRPEFGTIQPLASSLGIPFQEVVERYIEIDKRSHSLFEILKSAIHRGAETELIRKIASKFLASISEESIDLVEKLYHTTDSIDDISVRASLYNLIIDYSRSHGIMPFIAKGLYQKYKIERNDFKKLAETYRSGRYVLDYERFLDDNESIDLFYSLSVHAYLLMRYEESIELGKYVIQNGSGEYLAYAKHNVCNAYFNLKQYDACQTYLESYRKFPYSFVPDNVKMMTAFINSKTGNIDLAITQFIEYLKNPSPFYLVHVVSELMELYLSKNDIYAAEQLGMYEEQIVEEMTSLYTTPYKRATFGRYYRLKGRVLESQNKLIEAIDCYLQSSIEYSKISRYDEVFHSMSYVTRDRTLRSIAPVVLNPF